MIDYQISQEVIRSLMQYDIIELQNSNKCADLKQGYKMPHIRMDSNNYGYLCHEMKFIEQKDNKFFATYNIEDNKSNYKNNKHENMHSKNHNITTESQNIDIVPKNNIKTNEQNNEISYIDKYMLDDNKYNINKQNKIVKQGTHNSTNINYNKHITVITNSECYFLTNIVNKTLSLKTFHFPGNPHIHYTTCEELAGMMKRTFENWIIGVVSACMLCAIPVILTIIVMSLRIIYDIKIEPGLYGYLYSKNYDEAEPDDECV